LAKKKSTGSPKYQVQKTKIIKSPAASVKSGTKSPKSMDSQHPKKVQTPKGPQSSGKKSKKGKKLLKNIPVKSESEDEDSEDVLIEDDSDVEEIKPSPIKEGKLKAPQPPQKEKKSSKKTDKEIAVRAPKRKSAINDDDDTKMDVDEAKPPKRSRDDKWLTTLDEATLEETRNRELERSHRSLYFFEPKVPVPDEDMKALSSDIIFVQRKYPKKMKSAGYLVFADKKTCQANYEKLNGTSIAGNENIKLKLSLYKESLAKDSDKEIKVNSLKLIVNNITPSTTKGDLKKAFPNATLIYRHLKSPYSAYVYFYSPESARKAFDSNKDTIIRGSKIVVAYAVPKRARQERGPDADMMRKKAATNYVKKHGHLKPDKVPKKKKISKTKTVVA